MTGHPPALPHGGIGEIFPDIFMVQGEMLMSNVRFGRSMTILRHEGVLTLVNTVRLDGAGLAALDGLGKVADILRIGPGHGRDDGFYQQRYGAKLWGFPEFDYGNGASLDAEISPDVVPPVPGSRFEIIASGTKPEALVHFDREGGILIACDALQNWQCADPYMTLKSKLMMWWMGFMKPANIGPMWLKAVKPDRADFERIAALDFEHLLPSHGQPIIGGAKAQVTATVARIFGRG